MSPRARQIELVYRTGALLRGVVIRRLTIEDRGGRYCVRLSGRGDPETIRTLRAASRRTLRRLEAARDTGPSDGVGEGIGTRERGSSYSGSAGK